MRKQVMYSEKTCSYEAAGFLIQHICVLVNGLISVPGARFPRWGAGVSRPALQSAGGERFNLNSLFLKGPARNYSELELELISNHL
jgi:hypothetical protein